MQKKSRSLNNQLICLPPVKGHTVVKKDGNLPLLGNSTNSIGVTPLVALMPGTVSMSNMDSFVDAGDTVYVRTGRGDALWLQQKCECEEVKDKDGNQVKFIIVPGNEVVFVVGKEDEPKD